MSVRIAFAGLSEIQTAEVIAGLFGGTPLATPLGTSQVSATSLGMFNMRRRTVNVGASRTLGAAAVKQREIEATELVTPAVSPDTLQQMTALCDALTDAGAVGGMGGVLLGLPLEFEIEVPGRSVDSIIPVIQAYAVLEDYLRLAIISTVEHRALPAPRPMPTRFANEVIGGPPRDMSGLMSLYEAAGAHRDTGLDLMPLFAAIAPSRFADAAPSFAGPPVFHYRLPVCRLDDGGWSLIAEWNRWVSLERIASDKACLRALQQNWAHHRASRSGLAEDWVDTVASALETFGYSELI